jgi:hypothetical protein
VLAEPRWRAGALVPIGRQTTARNSRNSQAGFLESYGGLSALFASKTDRIHQDVDLTTEPHERRGGCDVGTASTPESYLASAKLRDRRWVGPKPKSTDTLKLLIDDFPSAFLDLFDGCGSRLHLRCVLLLFIVGGIFSFLPILGAWMLPLGLLLIAQDVTALQKPIVTALMWTEARWKSLKAKWHAARCRKAG